MNCLELRRKLLEDPFREDSELIQHERDCNECAAFARQLLAQEAKLRGLLQSVTPPTELADNIALGLRLEGGQRRRRQAWYAAAAGVVLMVGASMTSLFSESWQRGNMALAQSVLDHINDESSHLRTTGLVGDSRLHYVFARFGAQLRGPIGPVSFAAECLMRRHNGIHLVLPGERGPVTVFFMPGEHPKRSMSVGSERFQGRIIPTTWGSIALVGERGEPLDGFGQRLATAVNWPGRLSTRPVPG